MDINWDDDMENPAESSSFWAVDSDEDDNVHDQTFDTVSTNDNVENYSTIFPGLVNDDFNEIENEGDDDDADSDEDKSQTPGSYQGSNRSRRLSKRSHKRSGNLSDYETMDAGGEDGSGDESIEAFAISPMDESFFPVRDFFQERLEAFIE